MPGPKPTDPMIRFWRKVDRKNDDECWLWLGGRQGSGYGQFYRRKRVPIGAHRYSWEIANGVPVPPRLHVMHSCDNRICVNPAHLSIGTAADNNRDTTQKGRNPGNRTKGRAYRRKIDDGQVRALRDAGLMYHQIASVLGIATSTAWRAARRDERNYDLALDRVGPFILSRADAV